MTEAAPLELRVLAGRVRGASAPMDMGRSVTVGHDFENDIVLRDATAKGVRFRIRAKADTAELQVLEGQVELLGHALAAPASAVLPPYMPLIVGDSAVALGAEGSPR